MNKQTDENLNSLLQQAQEQAAAILRRFEDRLQALANQPAAPADPTARRWRGELTAAQTRAELRSVHRQIAHTIRIMQLRDVISEGEAAPVSQALDRLFTRSLGETEELLHEARRTQPLPPQSNPSPDVG